MHTRLCKNVLATWELQGVSSTLDLGTEFCDSISLLSIKQKKQARNGVSTQ